MRTALATLIVLGWMRWRGLAVAARDGTLIPGLIAGALFGRLVAAGLVLVNQPR